MNKHGVKTARPVARLRQGRNDWYRFENKASSNSTEIYIYDEIGFWGVTAQNFVDELKAVKTSSIELHVNSPGGDAFDGIAIYNALKDHSANVTVHVDALAASAASIIAMAGDTVVMKQATELMIHDAWGMAVGNGADMREMADVLDRLSNDIAGIYASRAGGETAMWRDRMRAETWYNAEEAVEAGLADEVRGKADGKDANNSWDLSIFSYKGRGEAPTPVELAPVATTDPTPEADEFEDVDFEQIAQALKGVFS